MAREIPKAYEPQSIEERWSREWFEENLFRAEASAPGPVFSIVIPPPNVTGSLHMGHMLDHTEIDILTRWHRMRGFNTLYLPGTDHAGIGTQVVVERELAKEGLTRAKLGRAEFEERIWKWKKESGGTIKAQMIRLGESCDWTRERFTLDEGLSRAVREVFVRLYEEDLIYRGHHMVNWCPRCQTAISDLETIHEERTGKLWRIRYPLAKGPGSIVVATTRPETMLGDTAVAVHPEDERYTALAGRRVKLPLTGREIPIVEDAYVDREFGTGAVKITPAHDPNDFEMGKRHGLAEIEVMTGDAHMNAAAGKYAGMERFAARKEIVADLKALGLLEGVTEHVSSIGLCDRCKTIIEPRASTQWFVRMKPLAGPAMEAVQRGDIELIPEYHRATFFDWMENIRDWCISRQLWWGHRIPAWHCGGCAKVTVARTTPEKCAHCGSGKIEQDSDVLDTWFSSSLWPFSTLGWPEETEDLRKYYPTSTLLTARDILFFWVARMIMMGLKFTGQAPFRQVYFHSLVMTPEGQKMSKSKGTGIDPLKLISEYGTDALRYTLASMAAPGTDIILTEDRMQSGRAFANKIWNAIRFLFVNLEKAEANGITLAEVAGPEIREGAPYAHPATGKLSLADARIFSRLQRVSGQMNEALREYRFHEAGHLIYHFFWGDICDWHIEWVKPQLLASDREEAVTAWRNLFAIIASALRLLHPMMPFLTEELWRQLPQRAGGRSIAFEAFPEERTALLDADAEGSFGLLQDVIGAARNIRAELKMEAKKKAAADFFAADPEARELVAGHMEPVLRLGSLSNLTFCSEKLKPGGGTLRSTSQFDLSMAQGAGADPQAEAARLRKDKEKLTKDLESKRNRLADDTFRRRAPAEIVRGLEATLAERQIEYEKIIERLAQIEGD